MTNSGNGKGAHAEEAIRVAFQKLGYFAVRSVPYSFREYSVTDIDLWLYGRAGVFRERINVDVKNKKTPQAIERIFWALGVMRVFRLDRCIVATTETNPAVLEFGKQSGVTVVDGRYLRAAVSGSLDARLTEEQLCMALQPPGGEEAGKMLLRRYSTAKTRLLTHLNFDGCNHHLLEIRKCMEELHAYPGMRSNVRRLLYILLSYLALTLDFLMSRSEFGEVESRRRELDSGLRYGSGGRTRLDEFAKIIEGCEGSGDNVTREIVDKLRAEAGNLRVDMIADFVVTQQEPGWFMTLAKEFEAKAFHPESPPVVNLAPELKSFLLMLVDFHSLDRKMAVSW